MSTKLSRDIGLFGLTSIAIGAMIGGGIFVLPLLAAAKMGPSVWLAYLIAGILVVPAALAKSELATAMPGAGGTYLFVERSLGPVAGTVTGIGVWLVLVFKGSFALVGVSYYLVLLVDIPPQTTAVGLLGFLCILNCLGAKKTARFQLIVVGVCLASLAVLVVRGFGLHGAPSLVPELDHGVGGLIGAVGFVFISYAGVTSVASMAEEARRPARDLPLSMLLSLFGMMLIYSLIALTLTSVLDWRALTKAQTIRPISVLGEVLFGPAGAITLAVIAGLALVSMANSGLMAASRYPLAMARDQLLPAFLARSSVRLGTPTMAILVTAVSMLISILTLDIVRIAKLASAFKIAVFAVDCLCVVVFRESNAAWYKPTFRSPLYPLMPVSGCLGCLAVLFSLGWIGVVSTLATGVLGLLWYAVYVRTRTQRRGLLQQMWKREDLAPPVGLAGSEPEEDLPPRAEVLVPLLGHEISPEALIEEASALAGERDQLEVLHLKEVPPQTALSAALAEEEDRIRALERRIRILGKHLPVELHFDSIVSRDARSRLHEFARRAGSRWIVMEWLPAESRGFFVRNPLSWWMTHVPCNLAIFKDAGNRYTERIAAWATPGPHDGLVVHTADRLASQYKAQLALVGVVPKDADSGEVARLRDYHQQLDLLCHTSTQSLILRGDDVAKELIATSAEFDLLVLSAAEERPIWSLFFEAPADAILEGAHCSVMRLKAPRKQTHAVIERAGVQGRQAERLETYLDPQTVATQLGASSKEELFGAIAGRFAAAHPELGEASALEEALWARERLQNTGIGDGIAIPHATTPDAQRTYLCLFTLAAPLDYQTAGAAVDIVFATFGPPAERAVHLQLLAAISRLLIHTDLAARLRAAPDAETALDDIARASAEAPTPPLPPAGT